MVEAELGRFGDKRLADVGNALLASMRSERTLCLRQLAKDRNQFVQFGRFVANPAVTAQEMLASAARLTDQRATGRHVLAIMSLPRRRPGTPPTCASPPTRPASAASAATPTTPVPVCSCIRCWRSMPIMAV
jgi:hypothetical protein